MQLRRYSSSACPGCPMKSQSTPSTERRITRWQHESVLDCVALAHEIQQESLFEISY